jgi:hypothetical protein
MEAVDSSETSVNFYKITGSQISEYVTINTHCSDDLVPNIQSDSKLLSGFPWPITFKPEIIKPLTNTKNETQNVLFANAILAAYAVSVESPLWAHILLEFIHMYFPGRWVGRDELISWPPHSPDIMPLDFFLWGYVRDIVYKTPVTSVNELKLTIFAAIE